MTVKKTAKVAVLVLTLAILAYAGAYLGRLTSNGSGFVAKHLCSLIHVSGIDPERAQAIYIDRFVEPFGPLLDIEPQPDGVEARILWGSGRAVYRGDLGCIVEEGEGPLPSFDMPEVDASPLPAATPEEMAATFDAEALQDAVGGAFRPVARNTLAVLVLHRGRVVSERYAEGITPQTRLPGWSMTKSVTATLVGILEGDGIVDVHAPGAISEWRGTEDPRADITLDQLLRMTSGLDITEDQSGADPNSRMLFNVPDAAAYAAGRRLQTEPGKHWEYMSGNTVLVSRAISQVLGGSLGVTLDFVHDRLFEPLGITSAVMEPDPAGTLIGSSFMLATAREWAKLGQLYVDDGVWEGVRIFPPAWRSYVTRHTPESGGRAYGAGFWLTSPDGESGWNGVPLDAFYMDGFQGQVVMMIPSEELVLVRLGASPIGTGIGALAAGVVAARRK
jgi:CubicO group peptidase (beta-lactamase class C family)